MPLLDALTEDVSPVHDHSSGGDSVGSWRTGLNAVLVFNMQALYSLEGKRPMHVI